MSMDRRAFIATSAVALGASAAPPAFATTPVPSPAPSSTTVPTWIWYPGQLAAYRHARRIRLAVERCTHVGYPANFRQPLTQAWFRKTGVADRDQAVRWKGPAGRIRVKAGGKEGDITDRQAMVRAGTKDIVVQIDFADTMPCLLLDGGPFSTGPLWEASLDGVNWVVAETSAFADPARLPDAEREKIVALPVSGLVPAAPLSTSYTLAAEQDLVVDFRETEIGAVAVFARGQGQLVVQVGESVAEVRDADPRWFEQVALPPIELTGERTRIVLPERALRYARFSTTGSAALERISFNAKVWPAEPAGDFECSDPELNAIWRAAVATLRSNMHDFYLDGIRRDGLVWHDGPLSLEAVERVFFDADLSRQTLIAQTLPASPSERDIGIIDSQMYAVIGFGLEYRMRGDAGFSAMFRDRITDILGFYMSHQDERGFVDARRIEPYGYFPDWSANKQTGPDAHGAPAYGQMLLAGAFAAGGQLAASWGDAALARTYADRAAALRHAIREAFRDPTTGLYANGYDSRGKLDSRATSFAQAYAVAFDLADPSEHAPLFAMLGDTGRRPAKVSLSQVVELAAYAKAGRTAAGVARLKSAWLPLVKQGYRRFFEDIDPGKDPIAQLAMYGRRYGNSLCHIWAGAAPVLLLSKGVLGIEPITPGYETAAIRPQPSGLQWGRGTVPTPHGPITVEWSGSKGWVDLPDGVSAVVGGRQVHRGRHRFAIS